MQWRCETLARDVEVWVTRPRPELPPKLDQLVETLWMAERAVRPALFNGAVFSVDRQVAGRLEGHWTEYRRIVAQIRRPDLAASIAVSPLAVAGLLEGPDGIVFGRRPSHAVYQAGLWQLAPAGNVDPASAQGDRIDLLQALHAELHEELGLPAGAARAPRHFGLLHHPGINIVDLGIALATDLSEADIRRAHAEAGDGEYPELAFVRRSDLPDFLAEAGEQVGRQVVPFLRAMGALG